MNPYTNPFSRVIDDTCGPKAPVTERFDSVETDTVLFSEKIISLMHNPLETKKNGQNGQNGQKKI